MAKQTPESNILEGCCQYLEVKRHVFWRQNNTPIYDTKRNLFRKMPRWSKRGVSDIICLKDGRAYFIECKAERSYLSQEQKEFKALVESTGNVYLLVRDWETLKTLGF